jgi:hypothetical protein
MYENELEKKNEIIENNELIDLVVRAGLESE